MFSALQRLALDVLRDLLSAVALFFEEGEGPRFRKTVRSETDLAGDRVALQGNMDPSMLFASPQRIRTEVASILAAYGHGTGQAIIAIMRPDGVERILQFDGNGAVSPGKGKIRARRQSDEWTVIIDDVESYRIPVAAIEGG